MPTFIDANIFIYATGNDARWRAAGQAVVRAARTWPGAVVTSAEVMQEVLNVTLRRGRPHRIAEALDLCLYSVHGRVEPLHDLDVVAAAELADANRSLQARDLIHLAVMARLGISSVISADRAFERVEGIVRRDPLTLESWRADVFRP